MLGTYLNYMPPSPKRYLKFLLQLMRKKIISTNIAITAVDVMDYFCFIYCRKLILPIFEISLEPHQKPQRHPIRLTFFFIKHVIPRQVQHLEVRRERCHLSSRPPPLLYPRDQIRNHRQHLLLNRCDDESMRE